LRRLFREEYLKDSLDVLIKRGEEVNLDITEEQAENLRRDTIRQAAEPLWFCMEGGRLSASNLKKICGTNLDSPSISLMNAICYPEKMKFTSKATSWGCDHEDTARKEYATFMKKENHVDFAYSRSGM